MASDVRISLPLLGEESDHLRRLHSRRLPSRRTDATLPSAPSTYETPKIWSRHTLLETVEIIELEIPVLTGSKLELSGFMLLKGEVGPALAQYEAFIRG